MVFFTIMFFDKMIKNALMSLALFFQRFLAPQKYSIQRVMLEYESTGEQCDIDSPFWKNEVKGPRSGPFE